MKTRNGRHRNKSVDTIVAKKPNCDKAVGETKIYIIELDTKHRLLIRFTINRHFNEPVYKFYVDENNITILVNPVKWKEFSEFHA